MRPACTPVISGVFACCEATWYVVISLSRSSFVISCPLSCQPVAKSICRTRNWKTAGTIFKRIGIVTETLLHTQTRMEQLHFHVDCLHICLLMLNVYRRSSIWRCPFERTAVRNRTAVVGLTYKLDQSAP